MRPHDRVRVEGRPATVVRVSAAEPSGTAMAADAGARTTAHSVAPHDAPDPGPRLTVRPSELKDANEYVARLHRHHKPVLSHRFSMAVVDEDGERHGVAIVGRPVAGHSLPQLTVFNDDRLEQVAILEVLRVCTDGTRNACSALYGGACRTQRALGYSKCLTYTLVTESGTSLRAAGWKPVAITDGGSWNRKSRPREDKAPTMPKVRWECMCSNLSAIELVETAMASPRTLRLDLEKVWTADTAFDPDAWNPARPSIGHCAVTALLVQEYTDAKTILRVVTPEGSHYFNALPDGTEIDLTRDQFDNYEPEGPPEVRTREDLLSNADTARRYEQLRSRLGTHWFEEGLPGRSA